VTAREILLALVGVSAALRADGQAPPDFYDAFRERAFLQGDTSFVARDPAAPREAPPPFRMRWVVLRFSGFAEKEREFWPYRNVLLVTMASGARYVVESSFGFVDEKHLDEERPWQRVASEKSAFEVWASGTNDEGRSGVESGPCEGMRQRVRAAGGTLVFFALDLSSRTVRTTLKEIGDATFDEDERRDLKTLLGLSFEKNPAVAQGLIGLDVRNAALGVSVAFRDSVLPPEKRTFVLEPDPAPPSDLASWRGLAHLPLDLPPFPALPPESGR
jgi:hypothetical protein